MSKFKGCNAGLKRTLINREISQFSVNSYQNSVNYREKGEKGLGRAITSSEQFNKLIPVTGRVNLRLKKSTECKMADVCICTFNKMAYLYNSKIFIECEKTHTFNLGTYR